MRILHLVATNDRRGAETFAKLLDGELTARGHDSSLVAVRRGAAGNLQVPVLGGDRWFPLALWAFRRRAAGAEVVVAHGSITLPVAVLSGVATQVPVVYRSIGDPSAWQTTSWRRTRTRMLLRRCRQVITVWDGARHQLLAMYHLDPQVVATIPNAYDESVFHEVTAEERSAARRALAIGTPHVVAFVGALSPEKRPHDAIASAAPLPDTTVLVVGDGPLAGALRASAPSNVRFLGALTDVRQVYAATDVVLQTSRTEGMSAVLLEAAACGRPVVTTDVGAAREIVDPGVTGEIAPIGDVPALRAALQSAIERRDAMGEAGVRRAQARYRLAPVTNQWVRQLQSIVDA